MWIDKAKIYLESGKGGDGAISFRHEKCIEFGGPNGGNGGRGGSIYFIAKKGINSLSRYRHAIKVKADDGEKGHAKMMYGKGAEDVYLEVPCGTVILSEEGDVLADLLDEGSTYLACKGGRGGRGNACFVSSTNRTPRTAENGVPGEKKTLYLELKLLADVGLVGLPSVGKSTLLSVISRAKPEIAAYPFTTLSPNLGVCYLSDDESFVCADLPGLIEGAHLGKGLGLTFLRHIERCRVIIHVLDVSSSEEDPFVAFEKINSELESYNMDLLKRPMLIALNKIDFFGSEVVIENFKRCLSKKYGDKYEVFEISALEKKGLKPLIRRAYELVQTTPKFTLYKKEDFEEKVYDAKKIQGPIFKIMKVRDNHYKIVGDRVIRTYHLINIKIEEGMMKLLSYLNDIGVDEELRRLGAKDGSIVELDDFDFEYYN